MNVSSEREPEDNRSEVAGLNPQIVSAYQSSATSKDEAPTKEPAINLYDQVVRIQTGKGKEDVDENRSERSFQSYSDRRHCEVQKQIFNIDLLLNIGLAEDVAEQPHVLDI